jgi:hypothetical protein
VGVKLTAKIIDGYEYREIALGSVRHFIVSFAELRLDER